MIVTKIEPVTGTKYNVYLDDQFAFVLYKGELSRYGIETGRELTREQYEQIRGETVLKRAKQYALRLLTDMGLTESQLRRKLRQAQYPADIVEEAVSYVRSFGYIDDERYARDFIEYRKEKKSRREILAQLSQKGLDQEVIDRAVEECYGREDGQEAIRKLLEKRRFDPAKADQKEMSRTLAYLGRKGFDYEDIRVALANMSETN